MSYCRWSCDNYRCDLYCYADVAGGWTTHVAKKRHDGEVPSLDLELLVTGKVEEFLAQYEAQHKALEVVQYSPIGLPHDGETFRDFSLSEFRERLVGLRAVGYRFPEHVLEIVDTEIAENQL